MLYNALKFTLQYSVTHLCECNICNNFKEHILVVKAIEGKDSFTWKAHNAFEKDLVSLEWTIALTGAQGQLNDTQESHMHILRALNSNLEHKNYCLTTETEVLCRTNKGMLLKCRELKEVLKLECLDINLKYGEINLW